MIVVRYLRLGYCSEVTGTGTSTTIKKLSPACFGQEIKLQTLTLKGVPINVGSLALVKKEIPSLKPVVISCVGDPEIEKVLFTPGTTGSG